MSRLTIGSLFSGIGGLELGLEWAGLGPALWQVEWEAANRHWLAQHWPDAVRHNDVCAVGAHNLEPVDVICGGFPCQPHSTAGLRKGSSDERDLWGEFGRVIRELRPRYVVGENVPGLLTSDGGRFFNRVLSDLAEAGFDVEWDVLSAADVGAPHLRERLFIIASERVAHARRGGVQRLDRPCRDGVPPRPREGGSQQRERFRFDARGGGIALGHADGERGRGGRERPHAGDAGASGEVVPWREAVPLRGADGTVRLVPADAAARGPESPLWPVAHGVPGRVARLRAAGTAVVPQVAEVVGRMILAREQSLTESAA
jgi:hypothetical protein